ncbi:Malectin-like domain - like 3, partial [Theobroma cacao]
STTGWINIDCGNDALVIGDNGLPWSTDEEFTKAGKNKRIPERVLTHTEMATLRYFPNASDQNCYTLPTDPKVPRYLIRAGFVYGNYDGLDHPPTFDLEVDGKKWSTVTTTSSTITPVYQEVMHATRGSSSVNVCLKQTRDGEVPFVSSLEAVPLGPSMFPHLYTSILNDEKHNRIWASGPTPPIYNLLTTLPGSNPLLPNDPPESVLRTSTASFFTSSPIIMTVDFPPLSTPQSAYFVFYFTEMAIRPSPSDTRVVDVYVNGVRKATVAVEVKQCKVVTVYPEILVDPTANVTLAAADSSTLPPIISAMEVFTTVDHVQDHDKGFTVGAYDPLILAFVILIHVFVVRQY